jgi:hypothetical protein
VRIDFINSILSIEFISIIFTIFCIIVLINGSNFIDGINKAVKNYDLLISEIKNQRYIFSWELVVSKMLDNYKSKFNITQKSQLLQSYNNVNINIKEKQEKPGVIVSFSSKKVFCKTSFFSDGASILFRDRKTKNIIYNCTVGKSPGQWSYSFDGDSFVDWIVEVKQGINVIYSESLDLKDKKVLLKVNNNSDYIKNLIIDFIKSTGSGKTVTIATTGGQTIDGSATSRTITTQYKALVVVSDGANWYILSEFDGTF